VRAGQIFWWTVSLSHGRDSRTKSKHKYALDRRLGLEAKKARYKQTEDAFPRVLPDQSDGLMIRLHYHVVASASTLLRRIVQVSTKNMLLSGQFAISPRTFAFGLS
jgi:hypothetical protein